MKYKIYQIKNKDCKYLFDWWEFAKKDFNFEKDYSLIYEDEVPETDVLKGENYILEMLFTKFNIAHPVGFNGHSLSVSDVVALDDKLFYCDANGWLELKRLEK